MISTDRRPIGVFDSGLGGLTAVRELTHILPHEDIIYFGDTARVPYGTRSRETILRYARENVRFLLSKNIKHILIACGTVSATALDILQSEFDIPISGVVLPAANKALSLTLNKKIAVIATTATIRSGAYARYITKINPLCETISVACPLFVPIVENGRIDSDDIIVKTLVREYLTEIRSAEVDTLILGCTHYPLLSDAIAKFLGDEVALVDSGKEAAIQLHSELSNSRNFSCDKTNLEMESICSSFLGNLTFYTSDDPNEFNKTASIFLKEDKKINAIKINIENY